MIRHFNPSYDQYRNSKINRLADSTEQHMDIDALIKQCEVFCF
ncbi:hypothetical protein [Marinomonas rhizomae]|nr:hypothetical protein [Marinomonas rhizomae]